MQKVDNIKLYYTMLSYPKENPVPEYFINRYSIQIYAVKETYSGDEEILIGDSIMNRVLLGQALNNGQEKGEIFDTNPYLDEFAQCFFDYSKDDFKKEILDRYEGFDYHSDVIIIEHLHINKRYNRPDVGKIVLQDITNRFYGTATLLVIPPTTPDMVKKFLENYKGLGFREDPLEEGYIFNSLF